MENTALNITSSSAIARNIAGGWQMGVFHLLFTQYVLIFPLQTLVRRVEPHEWRRFDHYAVFVHHFLAIFSSFPGGPIDVDPQIFCLVQACLPQKSLFMRLRSYASVYINDGPTTNSPFLTDSIQEAHLHIPLDMDFLVEEFVIRSSQVSGLSLSGFMLQDSLLLLPHHLRSLVQLKLYFPPPSQGFNREQRMSAQAGLSILFHNYRLSNNLTHLALSIPADFKFSDGPLIGFFPNVKSLEISAQTAVILDILLCTHNLRNVNLDAINGVTSDWHAIFNLVEKTSATSLQAMELSARRHCVSLLHCLGPLLNIHTLTEFCIIRLSGKSWEINDDDIREIVRGWPLLQRFILPVAWSRHTTYSLTLRSLPFLSRLQHLHLLQIKIAREFVYIPQNPLYAHHEPFDTYIRRLFLK
jgi:hypothetical protein